MDRIENEVEAESPMEIEPTDTDTDSLPVEEVKLTQYGVDYSMCCKCGAWIVAKNADDSISNTLHRLKRMGHPAECWLFNSYPGKCSGVSTNF